MYVARMLKCYNYARMRRMCGIAHVLTGCAQVAGSSVNVS